jgi:iron complex outermembrane receptor protein
VKSFVTILIIIAGVWSSLHGQSIQVKVISSENAIEITGAGIRDLSGVLKCETDENGMCNLQEEGTYNISKEGYDSKTVKLEENGLTVVELFEKPQNLNEVLIKTNHFQSELKKIPASIELISTDVIQSNNGVNIAPVLNSAPGVYMHNGTLSTNRITIRGIGSRTPFGTSKIRSYYQDIPLTNGSGETTIEDIELGGVTRMEVLKGPSSSLFGSGLGGVIQIIPDKGLFNTNALQTTYTFGSFGLQKFLLRANLANKTNSANIIYSNTHNDGYRENNELKRQTLSFASNHYLNASDNLVIIANLIDLKAYIPSSLDQEDYINDPETAAFTWGRSKGFEDYTRFLLGLSWQHDFASGAKQISSVFGSLLNAYEARPFNILDQNTNGIGIRSRFVNSSMVFEKKLQWTAGLELFSDMNSFKTFDNLYQDFPPGTGSVKGDQLSDLQEKRNYINLFAEAKFHFSEKTLLDFGFNFNQTFYRLDDKFNIPAKDLSGNYDFKPIVSPKIGITHQLYENGMIFGLISHGFSPPTLEETLLPDGLINTDIRPETGWSYELGSRGSFIKNIFKYELSLYYMDIDNLLVARRTGDDQYVGVNAGKTAHKGIEISLNYMILDQPSIKISHNNGFGFNNYKFEDFKDLENDYSGNDLTGVPDKIFNSQLFIQSKTGLYGNITYQYVGAIPITDDNSVYSDKYQLVNTKIAYKKLIGEHFQMDVYLGFNNIFNEKYASMLQINASSFGNNAPRYYYPGEPSNFYSGINLEYTF